METMSTHRDGWKLYRLIAVNSRLRWSHFPMIEKEMDADSAARAARVRQPVSSFKGTTRNQIFKNWNLKSEESVWDRNFDLIKLG